eukprot:3226850-Amphidinium_carterae.1
MHLQLLFTRRVFKLREFAQVHISSKACMKQPERYVSMHMTNLDAHATITALQGCCALRLHLMSI